MYPRILWELVTDPLRSGKHTLGTAAVEDEKINLDTKNYKEVFVYRQYNFTNINVN